MVEKSEHRLGEQIWFTHQDQYPLDSTKIAAARKQISELEKTCQSGEPVNVPEELIQFGSEFRHASEILAIRSFLAFSHIYFKDNPFPATLQDESEAGIRQFFESMRPEGAPPQLWRVRMLEQMQSLLSYHAQFQIITKILTGQSPNYLKLGDGLESNWEFYFFGNHRTSHKDTIAPDKGFARLRLIQAADLGQTLLTHATTQKNMDSITSQGLLSQGGVLGKVCMSRGVVSLPPKSKYNEVVMAERVVIFDPKVLEAAGYPIILFDETHRDADRIKEVRFHLPVPLFLASAIIDSEDFSWDQESQWGMALDSKNDLGMSCEYGHKELRELAAKVDLAQKKTPNKVTLQREEWIDPKYYWVHSRKWLSDSTRVESALSTQNEEEISLMLDGFASFFGRLLISDKDKQPDVANFPQSYIEIVKNLRQHHSPTIRRQAKEAWLRYLLAKDDELPQSERLDRDTKSKLIRKFVDLSFPG